MLVPALGFFGDLEVSGVDDYGILFLPPDNTHCPDHDNDQPPSQTMETLSTDLPNTISNSFTYQYISTTVTFVKIPICPIALSRGLPKFNDSNGDRKAQG